MAGVTVATRQVGLWLIYASSAPAHKRIRFYLRQGGYVFARLCLFVCLSVCLSVCVLAK